MAKIITKNTAFLLLGQIGIAGLNAVTIVLLARYWGEYRFGVYSYAMVLVGFFTLLPDFGMKPILIREIARNRANAQAIVSNALLLKLALTAISILVLCASMFAFSKDPVLRSAVPILSLSMLLSSKSGTVRIVFESLFHADMEMKYPVLFQGLDIVIQTAVVVCLVLFRAGFHFILIGIVASSIPGLLFTVFYTKKRMTLVWKPHKGEMTSLLRKASPLFVYLLLAMLYERLDVFFLKSFWGDSQVGLYSSAFRMTAPLAFIPYAIATALYPLFSKNSAEQERISDRFFGFGLKALLVIGAAIGSAGILFGKSFFGIYGSLYAEAATPFQVLLWGQAVSFLTFFLVDFNNSQNRQLHNTVYMAVMVFFAFWVQRYLILRLGVLGASWAKIILNATGLAVLSAMAWNHLSLQQRRHVYTTAWILGLFLMAACGSFLRSVPFWMKGVTFGAAIAVCIRWLFSKEEKQLLRKMVQQYQTQSGTAT